VRAYVRDGCLVLTGAGMVAGMPWAEQAAEIRSVEIGQGVTGLTEGVLKGLPIETVNGMAVGVFNDLAAGGVRADLTGLSVDLQSSSGVLVLEVQTTDSLERPAWRLLKQVEVDVPTTGTAGFFKVLARP